MPAWTEAAEPEQAAEGAFAWSFAGELHLAPDPLFANPQLYDLLNSRLDFRYRFLSLVSDLSLVGDHKYEPSEPFMLGRYFYIEDAGVRMDFDILSLAAGRLVHRDAIDSP
jgi:hypothetical protein